MKKIRTRFAPSPTGYLHIGGLRTALFAYLIAKSQGGDFLLRVEDTDKKRYVEGSVEKLLDILKWAGIDYDEGPVKGGEFEPYVQSERGEVYKKYHKELLEKKGAYHCFCSSERLVELKEKLQASKLPPRYDRACRKLSGDEIEEKIANGEKFVIRQKMPLEGEVKVFDELRGEIVFKAEELEDHVLIKSDGMPTYQFASVVDDHLMEISHVSRAEEWIPSLPKNVLLYKAFGWGLPKFIHLPVVLNKGGGKLSKRQGDVSVEDFKNKGYLKEALINFNALLGWSPYSEKNDNDKDVEILDMDKLIKLFDYKKINASPAVFDQDKLDYFNGYYIRKLSKEKLSELCQPFLKEYLYSKNINLSIFETDYIEKVILIEQERMKKLSEIGELTEFFFVKKLEYEASLLLWKKMDAGLLPDNLSKIKKELEKVAADNWSQENLEKDLISFLKNNNYKIGDFLWPMRVALSGRSTSPGPFEIAGILGKEKTLERLDQAIVKSALISS